MAGAFESIQKPDVQQQILDQIKIIAPNYTASEVIASSIDQPIEPAAFPTSRKLDEIFDWYHQRINTGMKVTLGDLAKKFGYSESYLKQQHALFLNERGIKKENTKTNR